MDDCSTVSDVSDVQQDCQVDVLVSQEAPVITPQVEHASAEDPELQRLRVNIVSGDWSEQGLKLTFQPTCHRAGYFQISPALQDIYLPGYLCGTFFV